MRRIVSNTGPVLHLAQARSLSLLELAGEVHIPRAVDAEIGEHEPNWASQRPDWIVLDPVIPPYAEESAAWQEAGLLDAGEAEAIALARQIRADWLLTDDSAARLFGQAFGLEVHGSLGVVLWAAAVGHLDRADAQAALDRLTRSSLWLSAKVLTEARAALAEIFR